MTVPGVVERCLVAAGAQPLQHAAGELLQAIRLEVGAVGRGGHREAGCNGQPFGGHLGQAGGLAAHFPDVLAAGVVEFSDKHGQTPS